MERLGSVILREMGSFGIQGEHGEFKIWKVLLGEISSGELELLVGSQG